MAKISNKLQCNRCGYGKTVNKDELGHTDDYICTIDNKFHDSDSCPLNRKCQECGEPLTEEEITEALLNKLNLNEVCCDDCYADWIREREEEQRNPDNEGGLNG